jgi:hypothetical protein
VGNVYNANNLSPYTTYYWRVASIADIGISPFCDTRSFTTGEITEIPGIPLLSSPANYAINVSLTPTFVWTAANLALRYRLQIAMDPYFSSLVSDVSGIDQTTYTSELLPANTALYWRVASANDFGNSLFSVSRRFTTRISTASEDDLIPMWQNELMPNYPNPFNPHTTISFSLKDSSKPVSLNIYNTRGKLLRNLFNGIPPSHELSIVCDGNDDNNKPVSSGVYLYRLDSPEFRDTRKMLLSK